MQPQIYCRGHKVTPPLPILSHTNLTHTHTPNFRNSLILFSYTDLGLAREVSFRLRNKIFYASPHACYMLHSYNSLWCDNINHT